MRIFHGPNNIGGMATDLARAQRELGHEAHAHCLPAGTYGFQQDFLWPPAAPVAIWQPYLFAATRALRYDVFQFYYGQSMFGGSLADAGLLKKLGKRIFLYFCGCDVRDSKETVAKYRFSACKECWPMECAPNRARAIAVAQDIADGAFVSTPDLLEFVPGARLLPQPVDFRPIDDLAGIAVSSARTTVRIAHAPTDRQKKGTRHIVAAVDALCSSGVAAELVMIERMPRAEVLKTIAVCDVVVDQVMIGSYGMLAAEGMALGKPVVCYVREDLVPKYDEPPPVINANPETLEEVLGDLITSPATWTTLGARGRAYARRWHESKAVAARLLQAYSAQGAGSCVS